MKQSKVKLHSQKKLAEKLKVQTQSATANGKPVSSANGFAVA